MTDKKIMVQFLVLTFCIAYFVAGTLIILGHFGYSVYSWVETLKQFIMNIPFAIYTLSPAIVSYFVLRKNKKITSFKEWFKTIFYFKNSIFSYMFIIVGLALYFFIHIIVSGYSIEGNSLYIFLLSLIGNLIIGGLEEAGWMYILQPIFYRKYGFVLSSIYTGAIWVLWHIPLFFIPGTNHYAGIINFGMFVIQLMSFRFFYGAIYKISGKGYVFMAVLFHTMYNALSNVFNNMTMTWTGTMVANTAIIFIAIVVVYIDNKKNKNYRIKL